MSARSDHSCSGAIDILRVGEKFSAMPDFSPQHVDGLNRRDFLCGLSAGVTALALAGPLKAADAGARPLGVALVGLGYYSTRVLAPALQHTRNCRLTGIVTGTPAKIAPWREKYGIAEDNVYNYETFDEVADNPEIDVIYVVLPNSMHAEFTIRAARAGKHVFCEKPMALTEQECRGMIDACRENDVRLTIGYRMQHEPNTRELMRIARDQPYGAPVEVRAAAGYREKRGKNYWKLRREMGGGAMYDMGVYSLQATRYCTGLEPIAVTARRETTRPELYDEVDEITHFQLEFPGGAKALGFTSLAQHVNDLEIDYTDGDIRFRPFSEFSGIQGVASDGRVFDASIPSQQVAQMDNDARAILEDGAVNVPGEEGLRDIRVVEAVARAAETGERVELPELPPPNWRP